MPSARKSPAIRVWSPVSLTSRGCVSAVGYGRARSEGRVRGASQKQITTFDLIVKVQTLKTL